MSKEKNNNWSEILQKALIIILSVLGALILGAVFLLIQQKSPIEVYKTLLFVPATNLGNAGQVMKEAIPLVIIGVGVSIASKCGLSNLGGDGQFYMGALGFVLVSMTVGERLGRFSLVLGILVAMLMGALTAAIAGVFRAYFKVSEIITTLMLNYIVQYFISWLVNGPIKSEGSTIAQTAEVPECMKIARMFKGTTASWSVIIAIACAVLYWLLMTKMKFGYNIRTVGGGTKAAKYSGINTARYYMIVMAFSGVFGGLAGAVEVASQKYRLLEGLSNSFGFNAILVSLLGMLHPIGVVLAAVFFAWLSTGANVMQITCGVPVTFVAIIKGIMILFILFGMSIKFGVIKLPGRKKDVAADGKGEK